MSAASTVSGVQSTSWTPAGTSPATISGSAADSVAPRSASRRATAMAGD